MIRSILLTLCIQCLSLVVFSQESVSGLVLTEDQKGRFIPVPYANVFWANTNYGTTTDSNGVFQLIVPEEPTYLVASFVGYTSDTLYVKDYNKVLSFRLSKSVELSAVEIEERRASTRLDFINPLKMEDISERELFKAACCNLSESFETNPSVDVHFSDAVSGNRQIKMLGIGGPYIQINREQLPGIRGLGNSFGLTFIPGSWVESIQLTKGPSSVVNGFESMSGQINVELRKPEEFEHVFMNLFVNQAGRMEANILANQHISEKWFTNVLLHVNSRPFEQDMNSDGFRDFPLQDQINLMNRWKYMSGKTMRAQFGFHYLRDEKTGGETDQRKDDLIELGRDALYRLNINTERIEAFGKMGFVFPGFKYRNMGFQMSASRFEQDAKYGLRQYEGLQQTIYANYIYQSIIGNTFHKFKVGASYWYDEYDEQLEDVEFDRIERIPGAFFEYSFVPNETFSLIAGGRYDDHNLYDGFFTPRVHIRYAPDEFTVIRALAGSGQRTINPIAERQSLLASSRTFLFLGDQANLPYGMPMEKAWNFGFNITRDFTLDYRDGFISVDLYRTQFEDQLIVDLDEGPDRVLFYNLEGESYANNLQLDLSYEIIKFVDFRAAYRFTEVRTDFLSGLRQSPFTPKHRFFVNLAYSTSKNLKGGQWMFDLTTLWLGEQRIPTTEGNSVQNQRSQMSPSFFLLNGQVSRVFNQNWTVYLGVENILNYRQDNPIISSDNPFGNEFDASMVWGPIFGRMAYVGVRMKYERKKGID